jgi:hypothetical protein
MNSADPIVSHLGYRYSELKQAFDHVCNADDWKAPISVWCQGEGVLLVVEAITYFTATAPKVSLDQRTMRYLIESEGYRNGPAGE